MSKYNIEQRGYYPYKDLAEFRDSEYFEDKFLEYYQEYRDYIDGLYDDLDDMGKNQLDVHAKDVVRMRNDEEIERIFNKYRLEASKRSRKDNEEAIVKLKKDIRLIKDIILAVEPVDMKRLQRIDNEMGELIDSVSFSLGITDEKRSDMANVSELLDSYAKLDADSIKGATSLLKSVTRDICEYYRKNFSVKTATEYINNLNSKVDKLIDDKASELGMVLEDEKLIDSLVKKFSARKVIFLSFEEYLKLFKEEIEKLRTSFKEKYSDKLSRKLIKKLDKETGMVIDKIAILVGYPDVHEEVLKDIFAYYMPECLDIFDVSLYSSLEERDIAIKRYERMTLEEKNVFEMKMYEQYNRIFKGKIRDLSKDIRRVYSFNYANSMIASFNKRADDLIRRKALEMGKPVPKNPWLIRKYLWADPDNFLTDNGIEFRKVISPALREIVKVAMNNKLVLEERPKLDSTQEYIYVSTHYFTEDIIGMYASLDRLAYVLMGTTDQIENNPLMAAAIALGLFYVDREDSVNRSECVEKQNRIIQHGVSFVNFVGGGWENSENELQPLSYSGPYKTSKATGRKIVPVASYLDREGKMVYVRYGEPLDVSKMDESTANEVIRDTLASMHFKQMCKHSNPIGSTYIDGYGLTHDLPYDQHTYYMDQIGNEYWNQYWSKPFATEEISPRAKKVVTEEEVYTFIDNLSRDKLIELSGVLAEPLLRMDEKTRYDIVNYLDRNYDRFKENNSKKKVKKKESSV